ncbi:MgtC/SapB family protein [Ensifer sp. HO-A22]|uniref:Protein MgtC n=1 Tax=Ensifer oleiphilus TaxID=2742698 RepID=A0A7Y6UMY2_9HYPH|nr:MgtC/SapB family protein [Ensifer oleiphilus]NVD39003.1 MgtC/SapB family protein [Ensifer oleiphilus]
MSSFGSTLLNELSITPNLAIAAFLGMVIGLERQWRQRYTGLTTHALVSLGAAAFTSLGMLIDGGTDVRMGGQVVTGIGFLGAGLIMRDGLSVRGLSGAATVWSTGAVGVLAGYGYLLAAAEACAFVLLINLTMPRIGALIERHAPEKEAVERYYMIELKCLAKEEAVVRSALLQAMEARKLRLRGLESHSASEGGIVAVEAVVYTAREQNQLVEQVVGDLSLSPLVLSGKWTSTTAPE